MNYTGYKFWHLSEDEMADWYSGKLPAPTDLNINEYLIIQDEEDNIVDKYCLRENGLKKVLYSCIKNNYCGIIKPRNIYQELAINMLQTRDAPVKIFRGTYGSGKDYLMSAEAISQIEQGNFNKLVYIRPNVGLANVPDIGYLKGGIDEKLSWTLAPLWDKFGGEDVVTDMQERGVIELVPLSFIRGRSFENAIVYVSEGQNITKEIAAVIISRLGENSELWINGDCHQTDKRIYDDNNGITAMINTFKGDPLFQIVYSPLTERSRAAQLAAKLMGE